MSETIFVEEVSQEGLVEDDFYLQRTTGASGDVFAGLELLHVNAEFIAARTRVEKQVFPVNFFEIHVVDLDFVVDVLHLLALGG